VPKTTKTKNINTKALNLPDGRSPEQQGPGLPHVTSIVHHGLWEMSNMICGFPWINLTKNLVLTPKKSDLINNIMGINQQNCGFI
jgi:hypothetical protein